MTPELKERWIEALHHYPKTKGRLKKPDGYCCLGVLADIEGDLDDILRWDKGLMCLPRKFVDKYGIDDDTENDLMETNDKTETFVEVIEIIKKEL